LPVDKANCRQGVANPAFIFAQPLPGLAQALRSAYPGAVVQGGATMWILGALIGADAPDIEALLEDLQQILTADREAQAVRLIEAFSARWARSIPKSRPCCRRAGPTAPSSSGCVRPTEGPPATLRALRPS
jgi:transposase-like protein